MSGDTTNSQKPRITLTQFKNYETNVIRKKKLVKKQLYKDIRDRCRSELDEYVICSSATMFPNFKCIEQYRILEKCIKMYHNQIMSPETENKMLNDKIIKGDIKIPKCKWY
ncbi:conserved Plasmodium protein, unknown function [Babesia microti strain RI]|uniref:COX assembly mitochondrial protein n=1 Tax=Babesia microti (strain RI) TaxID=1133968 RepID=A0A1N6LXG9_BABMR|nr:conserved Plasmodium protein, unknown function [Babesia microti strain RI]SIO73561.1 conserved Plasmodium protein, unknown function [Babesia microti strain RI]|eukprot:XP_021337649.1 conserved Plasmodium protein, unknown function [Babesia microti strain RI]